MMACEKNAVTTVTTAVTCDPSAVDQKAGSVRTLILESVPREPALQEGLFGSSSDGAIGQHRGARFMVGRGPG
jgi:hypothetical protein